jgi:glucose-6-phosphate isomerase
MQPEARALFASAAGQKLAKLARSPFDLTKPGVLTKERLSQYICDTELLRLCYGLQRVDDDVLTGLQALADELALVERFKRMRRGEVCNRIDGWESENRQALHTASRDLFTDTPAEPAATGAAAAEMVKLKSFLAELENGVITNERGEKFDSMIHLGIGGSDLGPRAIYEALQVYRVSGRQVRFIANVDPDDAAKVLREVHLPTTLVNIVSKSGTTLETLTNETLVRQTFTRAGLDCARHFLAVTGEKSPMDDPGRYLRSFYMQDYIGGRYSTSSMVGAVMLGFALGYDQFLAFLRGANIIDELAEKVDLRDNLPLLMALLGIWNHNFLGCPTVAVLPYSQALHRFPAHLQQCDMESNGKSIDRQGKFVTYKTGPIVWGEPGTNGQHAFYQLLHQGTEIVPAEFIGFQQSQYGEDLQVDNTTSQQKLLANLYAQMVALAQGQQAANPNRNFPGNRPSLLLLGQKLTPEVMGGLLAAYEAKIVFQGFAWNINSFDQEGVQLGKVLAKDFLAAMTGASGQVEGFADQWLAIVNRKA